MLVSCLYVHSPMVGWTDAASLIDYEIKPFIFNAI